MRSTPLTSCFLLSSALGCGTPDLEPIDTSPVADTERDTDRDTGSSRYTFDGEVTVRSTVDGAVVCDADAMLTGSAYTGDCPDCEFTFATAIDSVVTRDESSPDCAYYPTRSFIETWDYFDLFMAYTETYYRVYPYARYDDAFMSGWSHRYEYHERTYEEPGPYFTPIAYDGAPYSAFARTGNDVSWSYTFDGTYDVEVYNRFHECGIREGSRATEGFGVPGTGERSTIDCPGLIVDIWSFDADGGPATVTIDTLSERTAFVPNFEVKNPDGCTVLKARYGFTCSYPPPQGYSCPSASFESTTPGTYSVVVSAITPCAGPTTEYEIRVEGGTNVTLVEDEADQYTFESHARTIDIHGSGTLTASPTPSTRPLPPPPGP